MSGEIKLVSLLEGKLPIVGKKDWTVYYVELSTKHVHIFEGNSDPAKMRKHLQSLELHGSDIVGSDGRDRRNDYKFYYDRGSGGKYVFKCRTDEDRQNWIMQLHILIQKQEYYEKGLLDPAKKDFTISLPNQPTTPRPANIPIVPNPRTSTLPSTQRNSIMDTPPTPPPHKGAPNPLHKRDSGFVSGTGVVSQMGTTTSGSDDAEIVHGSTGSGDTSVIHSSAVKVLNHTRSSSADGSFTHKVGVKPVMKEIDEDEDLSLYDWYWGQMSREECGRELMERGKIGNFVVRKNDRGDYVMSFWRKDGVHHHRILKTADKYRFEKSVVQAEGIGIPDLLDTYMKYCTDKTIKPFGGELYPHYAEAWNPPEIDFNKFQDVLKKRVEETGMRRLFKPGPEMGDHTYGGLSLAQIKQATENPDFRAPPPSSPRKKKTHMTPPQVDLPPSSPGPISAKPPSKSPKPPTKTKPPKKETSPAPGYVNLFPPGGGNKIISPKVLRPPQRDSTLPDEDDDEEQEVYIAPQEIDEPVIVEDAKTQPMLRSNKGIPPAVKTKPKPAGYVNLFPGSGSSIKPPSLVTTRKSREIEEEATLDEDEEQEMYIAPRDIDGYNPDNDDEHIYQNHGFHNSQPEPQLEPQEEQIYVNINTPPIVPSRRTGNNKTYQNLTVDGKPLTPPRVAKASPQVRPKPRK